jgi:acyl carrier protein
MPRKLPWTAVYHIGNEENNLGGYMDTFAEIKKILVELLDLEGGEIAVETFLIKELGAESIDLLELAVAINSRFKIAVRDEDIFLTRFRLHITEATQQRKEIVSCLAGNYTHLTEDRITQIIAHIDEGPQLKIKDLISYITCQLQED